MDLKKQAAIQASGFVENDTIVGLGAGSTIAHLAEVLKQRVADGVNVQFVTSSYSTLLLLRQNKLPVQPIGFYSEIDIYFDGCDQVDKQLNALKSGGGIHAQEKLLACMAKQFILIGDEAKFTDRFDVKYPLVLEVLPQALKFVEGKIGSMLFNSGAKISARMSDKRDGPTITDNGNYLADVYFETWPDVPEINQVCKNIAGVVETSLFYKLAHRAVIAGEAGVEVINKSR